jgi:DNA polymerase-3 subunit epsilon
MLWQTIKNKWAQRGLKDQSYAWLFGKEHPDEVVCFDCETTGLDRVNDKLVSLSAIKIRGGEILTSETLNLTFKPEQQIRPESILVHRIRNMDTEQGLEEREGVERFLRFIGTRPLVGYYLEFDIAMVNAVVEPWLGIKLPNRPIEVSQLYHQKYYQAWLQPEHEVFDLSFKTIMDKLNLPMFAQHDAFNDALMTSMMYVALTQGHDKSQSGG